MACPTKYYSGDWHIYWKVVKAELVYCGHKVMASHALFTQIVPNNSGHAFPFRTIMRIYRGIKLLSIRACLVASSTTHLPIYAYSEAAPIKPEKDV